MAEVPKWIKRAAPAVVLTTAIGAGLTACSEASPSGDPPPQLSKNVHGKVIDHGDYLLTRMGKQLILEQEKGQIGDTDFQRGTTEIARVCEVKNIIPLPDGPGNNGGHAYSVVFQVADNGCLFDRKAQ